MTETSTSRRTIALNDVQTFDGRDELQAFLAAELGAAAPVHRLQLGCNR